MPAPRGMTVAAARREVLARCALLNDDSSNPQLDTDVGMHLAAAQRQLQVEHAWLIQKRLDRLAVAAGQRLVDLPAATRYGQVRQACWIENGIRYDLASGIDPAEQHQGGMPERYDLTPTTGIIRVDVVTPGSGYADGPVAVAGGSRAADGADPDLVLVTAAGAAVGVTVRAAGAEWITAPDLQAQGGSGASLAAVLGSVVMLELWPVPAQAGTLELRSLAGAGDLASDGDELALDPEAVIGRAAYLLAMARRLESTDRLLRTHNSYLSAARSQQSAGATLSLSGWRRDRMG